MYRLDSSVDKPDYNYLVKRVTKLLERGVQVSNVHELLNTLKATRDNISADISEKYLVENPNSQKQVLYYLQTFADALSNAGKSNPIYEACIVNGKWTTDKTAMNKLAAEGFDFAKDILEYRRFKGYVSNIESVLKFQDSNGRVHPKLGFTDTNRVTFKDPALMNISKDLLWNIIVPINHDDVLYSVDIKNQEPTILINLLGATELLDALDDPDGLYESIFKKVFEPKAICNVFFVSDEVYEELEGADFSEIRDRLGVEPAFCGAYRSKCKSLRFKNEGIDLFHIALAVESKSHPVKMPELVQVLGMNGAIYSLPVEWDMKNVKMDKSGPLMRCEVTGKIKGLTFDILPNERKEFKTAWLAMTYSASKQTIVETCKSIDGEMFYDYFMGIPAFKNYRDECKKFARKGYSTSKSVFGTVMSADEWGGSSKLARVLMNRPIQGTGADIMAFLIKHTDEEIHSRGLEGKLDIYFPRIDELILTVNKEWISEIGEDNVEKILKDIYEHQIDDWKPFKVEIKQLGVSEFNVGSLTDDTDSFEGVY